MLHSNFPDLWQGAFRGEPGVAEDYWRNVRDHPSVAGRDVRNALALGLRGDSAPFCKTQSLHTIAWNSLHGLGDTLRTRLVFTSVVKSTCVPGTLATLHRYLAWAMNALEGGQWPALDWQGKRHPRSGEVLAAGWRGMCVQVRGDWEFYADVFRFPRWNNAENMCWVCRASSAIPALAWTARDGEWRDTYRTHESYLAELAAAGREPCELFLIRTLRLEGVMIDVLHTVDLGVTAHLLGNTCYEIMMSWDVTQGTAVTRLNERLRSWYREQRFADARVQGKLTIERIKTSGGWPKLKAKGAAIRHLIAFAKDLAVEADDRSLHGQRRMGCLTCMQRFYSILAEEDRFLTDAAKTELPQVAYTFMGLYGALSAEAFDSGRRMWKLVPKFHLFQHLCEKQALELGNPKFYWTYGDEDMQQHMASIAQSCHLSNLAPVALHKWAILVFCREHGR